MSERDDALRLAKERLDVATLWRVLKLPGEPRRSCRCPFHEDKNDSFSVYTGRGGRLKWKCFGTCGQGGPVELLAKALALPEKEACRRLVELAGTDAPDLRAKERAPSAPKILEERHLVLPQGLRPGRPEELRQVANLRRLSMAGMQLASARGLLWFAWPRGQAAWIVLDRAKVNAQARRMDGGRWEHIGDKKAWTQPGSRAPWPIGTHEAKDYPVVALVEGGPDLLAACHFIVAEGREKDVAPVAVLGASNNIPDDALKLLAGKRVRLFPHVDATGTGGVAAARWTEQLEAHGCTVDALALTGLQRRDGKAISDLNDFALVDPACLVAEPELRKVLP